MNDHATPPQPSIPYRANQFSINLYEGWEDKTIFIISGPVSGGVQHNITINPDPGVQTNNLLDYADVQVLSLEAELKSCRILKREMIQLNSGMPAYRVIFRWYPTDELRVYQEQIYVLHEKNGYKLTATFTRKTRKTLGPQVERMMLSFEPKTM